jgi:MFS family permease
MASAYLISNFVFQYPSGWLADRWGRKSIMILGLFIQAVLSLVYLVINDPILFVVLRFAEGIAGASVLPPARALIADSVPAENRGEAFGIFSAFFNGGFLLGPALGGLLATTAYATAFIGAVLFRLVAIVIILTLVKVARKSSMEAQTQAKTSPHNIIFTLPLIGAYILVFGDFLYLGFDQTLLPIWMHDHLGASVALIGIAYMMFAIPNVILSPITGRVADRKRRSSLILIFGLAQVPLYITYGFVNTGILVAGLFAVHGIVYSLIQPAVDSHVATASDPNARARVQGAYSTAGLAGAFAGATVFSLLYGINFRLPLFAMGVAFGICVIVGGVMVRISEARGLVLSRYSKVDGSLEEPSSRRITQVLE